MRDRLRRARRLRPRDPRVRRPRRPGPRRDRRRRGAPDHRVELHRLRSRCSCRWSSALRAPGPRHRRRALVRRRRAGPQVELRLRLEQGRASTRSARASATASSAPACEIVVVRPGFVHTKMTEGLTPAPLATDPDAVADAIVAGLGRGSETIWAPGHAALRHVGAAPRAPPGVPPPASVTATAPGARRSRRSTSTARISHRDSLGPFLELVCGRAQLYRGMRIARAGARRDRGRASATATRRRSGSSAGCSPAGPRPSVARGRRARTPTRSSSGDALRPEMLERVAWHRAEGHEIVIVSASLDVYLEPLAPLLGVDHVLCTRSASAPTAGSTAGSKAATSAGRRRCAGSGPGSAAGRSSSGPTATAPATASCSPPPTTHKVGRRAGPVPPRSDLPADEEPT